VSPSLDLCVLGGHVPRREDVREEENFLVREVRLYLLRTDVGVGHPQVLRLPARVAAHDVGVAEQAGRRVAHRLAGQFRVRIRVVTQRVQVVPAEPARPATNGEGDDDPVARFQRLDLAPDLDHFAHRFVAQDVALAHPRDVVVVEVEV